MKTARLLDLSADDALLQFASLAFVASVGQIFAPLSVGARVVLRVRQTSAPQLYKYIKEKGVSVLWLTPSVIKYLTRRADVSISALGAPLRLVRSGGEALTPSLAAHWFRQSKVPILNVYGPTEGVQDITAGLLTEAQETINMGKPLFDVEVFVLDESGELVPEGTAGELFISTPGMARGYLNQPELTQERFCWRTLEGKVRRLYRTGDIVRRLPAGWLEYVGRHDRQVKVFGNRIELGEIEERLMAHDAVVDAAAAVASDPAGNERLVAYYVPMSASVDVDPDLLDWCAQALPKHMVPISYVRVAELPVTVNGKLDRRALSGRDPA